MRIFYVLALLSCIPLGAASSGSVHDAWTDWIIDSQAAVEEESSGELSENEQAQQDSEYKN